MYLIASYSDGKPEYIPLCRHAFYCSDMYEAYMYVYVYVVAI